jgi:hypothetical protein
MANDVFANGREVSCKAGSGKTICAFPDVCFTPPENPATPPGVPVPYPNTGMTSDTTSGSKRVKISGKEVMLKNKSYFKKSVGDEAGCAAKKGVLTSVNRGKVYFNAWSMDVKFEGENVVRHLDLTTHNHASQVGQTPPWPFMDSMAVDTDPCVKEKAAEKTACAAYKPNNPDGEDACTVAKLDTGVIQSHTGAKAAGFTSAGAWADEASKNAAANDCVNARRCKCVPWKEKEGGRKGKCCGSQTPDHLIPKSSFFKVSVDHGKLLDSWPKYDADQAPCLCAEGGSQWHGSHGLRHSHHKSNSTVKPGDMQSFDKEADLGAKGAAEVFKSSGCTEACIKAQLENGHKDMGDCTSDVKHSPAGRKMETQDITDKAATYSPDTVARG